LTLALGSNYFLSVGPEDFEPSVDPEDFGKRGVDCEPSEDPEEFGKGGVEVESEYDLELRIGGNVSRPKLVSDPKQSSALVRWSKEKASLEGCINHELGCHGCNDE
jgi:hypothetical protein